MIILSTDGIAEDRVKLFDFGLAIELPPSNDRESTFKLPGNTGTVSNMRLALVFDNRFLEHHLW